MDFLIFNETLSKNAVFLFTVKISVDKNCMIIDRNKKIFEQLTLNNSYKIKFNRVIFNNVF